MEMQQTKPRPLRWVFWGFLAVAAYFLFTEHRAHVAGILPYLLVLACPLMHLFHGHGHHHGHQEMKESSKSDQDGDSKH